VGIEFARLFKAIHGGCSRTFTQHLFQFRKENRVPITGVRYEIPQAAGGFALFRRVRGNPARLQTLLDDLLAGANLAQQGINGVPLPAPLEGAKWNDPGDPALGDPRQKWNAIWNYVIPPSGTMATATNVILTDIRPRR
jgi:hypothetical protein